MPFFSWILTALGRFMRKTAPDQAALNLFSLIFAEHVRNLQNPFETHDHMLHLCIMLKDLLTMNRRLTIVAFLFLLPLAGRTQCAANFTYQVSGNTVMFDGAVTPQPGPNASYYWWFSDNGSYSYSEDPVHTFSAAGTYSVCFSYYDASTSCSDSLCYTITVGSSICSADFTWIDTLGYTYFISSSTVGAGGIYFWDFGDGNFSSQHNPAHVYALAGVYNVCLYVYDSLQNFCDSACYWVTAQGATTCTADFTWIDTMGYTYFTSYSTAGAGALYYWDFGDGDYSYSQNPSHQYAFSGIFTVCLTVYDSSMNLCDSTCHNIYTAAVGFSENGTGSSFDVSPNPADELMQLSFVASNAESALVSFFDGSGRLAQQKAITVHGAGTVNTEINTKDMAAGIYLVKLEVNGTVAWKKIALTHQ